MADSSALVVSSAIASGAEARQQLHPLSQIAASGTHRLLLKQWVKEEDLLARRVALREARLDGARKEIAFLYCAFFAFHAASVLVLFLSSSASAPSAAATAAACRRSWIPCLVSLLSSLAMLWALRYKSDTEAVLERVLAREREDVMLLARCVSELKRKGLEFDLLKEVDALRRAKSLRVEAKGADKPRRWQARDLAVFALFAAACGVLVLTRFLLCN
ncbi:hypothetical protein HU200_058604 [Digitaria exilis]|uniref:Uncharacterized protein n=1 Tax=Digitaria exilis TaxID=1010633 RepID=A0A835AHT6_9POAL|nr:hypothetical protein HU200_058604 [Digitaria exilis]CAB3493012.1 unnamed protein product [Digitaria exilis]